MALGASHRQLARSIVVRGVRLAMLGAGVGLGLAVALTRVLQSLLFGTTPLDLPTYSAGIIVMMVMAALASYLPARRVTAVDPIAALRADV
jgi:ABC-type antimicrobial peptide transport system permease subunit